LPAVFSVALSFARTELLNSLIALLLEPVGLADAECAVGDLDSCSLQSAMFVMSHFAGTGTALKC